MLTIFLIYFFLLGIIIGSFLNVVIFRHNTGRSTGGRSACMTCKKQLTYKELIPVFSFLLQRGKCAKCKTKISWQYPIVELSTGLLFLLNFYLIYSNAYSILNLIISVGFSSCIIALFVVIFVYDLKHKIIPDLFSFSVFGLSVVWVFLNFVIPINNSIVIPAEAGIQSSSSWIPAFVGMTSRGVDMLVGNIGITQEDTSTRLDSRLRGNDNLKSLDDSMLLRVNENRILFWLNLLAGLIFYFLVYAIWKLSKGRMIGLGDAKLLLSIGTLLGIVYGLSSIFISVWIGAIFSIGFLLFQRLVKNQKNITMKTEIPFGPFLIIGFFIVYFLKIDVTNIVFILQNFS